MADLKKNHKLQTRVGYRLRIPHSPFPTPHLRRGISLLEVLISMFILAVGLLSIASLLPLGSFQAQKALIEDGKGAVGQNGYREFRTRGMADVTKWMHFMASSGAAEFVVANAAGALDTDITQDDPGNLNLNYLPFSVAIDPLALSMPSALATDVGGANSKFFPRLPSGTTTNDGKPRMLRVALSGLFIAAGPQKPNQEMAQASFMARDDAVWDKADDPDLPAISRWETDNPASPGVWLRREFAGNFSWLATLTPTYVNTSGSTALVDQQTLYNLSIVIFYRRSLNSRQTEDGQEVERHVPVIPGNTGQYLAGFGDGGGELLLQGNAGETAVRPGDWVMVCGRYNQPAAPTGPLHNRPVFRWYRVVTAGAYDDNVENSGSPGRQLTLSGPDWGFPSTGPFASWPCIPSHVAIFNDCVGVFEKTVRLEGPSMYSP